METYLNQIIAPIHDKNSKAEARVKIDQEFVKVEGITMDMSPWVGDTGHNCTRDMKYYEIFTLYL